jgi:hypothetical protein
LARSREVDVKLDEVDDDEADENSGSSSEDESEEEEQRPVSVVQIVAKRKILLAEAKIQVSMYLFSLLLTC